MECRKREERNDKAAGKVDGEGDVEMEG